MKTATALVIEQSDRTKDGNIKSEVFEAICNADFVIDGNRVVKNNLAAAPQAVVEAPQPARTRVRRKTTPTPAAEAPTGAAPEARSIRSTVPEEPWIDPNPSAIDQEG